jgi:hypothetical protein
MLPRRVREGGAFESPHESQSTQSVISSTAKNLLDETSDFGWRSDREVLFLNALQRLRFRGTSRVTIPNDPVVT